MELTLAIIVLGLGLIFVPPLRTVVKYVVVGVLALLFIFNGSSDDDDLLLLDD